MSKSAQFFKAPRYLFRKHNILSMIRDNGDIKSFVDIGCGAGELACTLAEKGYRGIGVDFSKDALKTANEIKSMRNISNESLKFAPGGIERVNPKEHDVIICCEVLEHIENDINFLRNLYKTKTKYAVFSVPARKKWFDSFDENVGHYRRYEKNDLMKLLDSLGFEVVDFRAYGYPYINVTRLIRKIMASKVKKQPNIKKRTQASGINPIKVKGIVSKIDIEPLIRALYWTSKPFNKFDLSEGYLIFCKSKAAQT